MSYVVPITYTGLVAFFRVAAGAHFFSDVLVGGTMGFLAVQFFRWLFLYRLQFKDSAILIFSSLKYISPFASSAKPKVSSKLHT